MVQKIIRHLFCQPHMLRRIVVLILSVTMMGVGVGIFDQIRFGTDPCAVLTLAVSRRIGVEFGHCQLAFNLILFLIILAVKEIRRIGLGSIANMVILGYAADATTWVINQIHPLTAESMLVKIAVFVPTMTLFLIAVAFYMTVDLGVAPYDAMPQIVAQRFKLPFSIVRMAWDILMIIIGFLLGGVVGVVTLITGFCVGPVVSGIAAKCKKFFV